MTELQQRLINFLEEDIRVINRRYEKLGKVDDNVMEEFLSYWTRHIDKLKPTKFDLFKTK